VLDGTTVLVLWYLTIIRLLNIKSRYRARHTKLRTESFCNFKSNVDTLFPFDAGNGNMLLFDVARYGALTRILMMQNQMTQRTSNLVDSNLGFSKRSTHHCNNLVLVISVLFWKM
jgi:hypothetical protein